MDVEGVNEWIDKITKIFGIIYYKWIYPTL